jgi:CRISPR system Cascade subunit CasE
MFLTRFPVNTTRRATREMLASPYRLHAAVAGSFPPAENEAGQQPTRRPLWRLDHDPSGAVWLYIVSPARPDLVGLDEQIGWPDSRPQWETKDYAPLLDRLSEGQIWAFRLVANPARTVRQDRSRYSTPANAAKIVGSRVGHMTPVQQAAWLVGKQAYSDFPPERIPAFVAAEKTSRAQRHGFDVVVDQADGLRLIVSDRRKVVMRRAKGRGSDIIVAMARFDGVLRIADAVLLRRTLTHGIGHAKAFGCGLLTLAPVAVNPLKPE